MRHMGYALFSIRPATGLYGRRTWKHAARTLATAF